MLFWILFILQFVSIGAWMFIPLIYTEERHFARTRSIRITIGVVALTLNMVIQILNHYHRAGH